MLAYERYQQPVRDLGKPDNQTVTASANISFYLEPPTAEDEWLLYNINISDDNSIDGADAVILMYRDEITSLQNRLSTMTLNLFNNNVAVFPVDLFNGGAYQGTMRLPFAVVKRRSTNEPWRRVRVNYFATGTVGSRSVRVQHVYGARRRLD